MANIDKDMLLDEVKSLLASLNETIAWAITNLSSAERQMEFKKLVAERRRLKRICAVLEENPSIAAYGESQKGKSYIISSLLSLPGQSFSVEDGDGNLINFIECINPPSVNENECTGLVTRFTMNTFMEDTNYPIKIKLLELKDVVLILADFYLKDLNGDADDFQPEATDLNNYIASIHSQYPDNSAVKQNIFTEDDVWDIYDYLSKHNARVTSNLRKSNFFDEWASFVVRQSLDDCVKVIRKIWDDNPDVNHVFDLLINGYKQLQFADNLYIKFDAVYNDKRDGSPTLMSVECLEDIKNLFDIPNYKGVEVPVLIQKGASKQVANINKSLLCMLVKEVTYKVSDKFVNKPMTFCFEHIRDLCTYDADGKVVSVEKSKETIIGELKRRYNLDQSIDKKILCDFDMLDFPGLRPRASNFNKAQISTALVKLLLRSKVTYLFTCYSENRQLSLLLFCHDQKMPSPNLIAPVLRNWVDSYIGENAVSRTKYIESAEIAPLFLISTKYNMDLALRKEEVKIKKIFEERFKTVLLDQVIDDKNNPWFNDWSKTGKFDNIYLLRDYKFSSDYDGTCSGLFTGYPGNEEMELNQPFRERLKALFVHDSTVMSIFKDPVVMWEVASTLGNDGTYFLIKNLTNAAEKNGPARNQKIFEEINEAKGNILEIIKAHYHEGDEASMLLENIKKARRFRFEMDRICSRTESNDFFGKLIQFLQITPSYVSEIFTEIINSAELLEMSDVREYELILKYVEECGYKFNTKKEAWEENFAILETVYGVAPEEVLKTLEPDILFTSSFRRNCSPSYILSSKLIERWFDQLMSPEKAFRFRQIGFNDVVMSDFLVKLKKLVGKYDMPGKMAVTLKEYVDYGSGIQSDVVDLLADLASSEFNSFIMSLGCDYMNEEERAQVERISEEHKLNIKWPSTFYNALEEEEMYNIIDSLLSSEGPGDIHITRMPSYQRMQQWLVYLMIAHIVSNSLPMENAEANEALGVILKKMLES